MTAADELVIQLALEQGLLRDECLASARARLAATPDSVTASTLIEVLMQDGALTPRQASRLLAQKFNLPETDLRGAQVSRDVLGLVPRSLAVRYQVFPLARADGVLRVALADPLDPDGLDSLSHVLGVVLEPSVAPASEIKWAIAHFYDADDADTELAPLNTVVNGNEISKDTATSQLETPGDAPVIKFAYDLILAAIRQRASDIHLEPLERRFRMRYRIDGVLLEVAGPPKCLQLAIISRLKLMANISIAEKRLPQDGRIQFALGGKMLDLRVSSLPTVHGESIVMRILDKAGLQLGLPELGFLPDDRKLFERLIAMPDGIILATGPTGSGKTTTLYACLHQLNRSDRKIITVEDPVEYQLTGINQTSVRAEVGMTFAAALRAMLRQAPNIVMVGEIRDRETAEVALHASLTGHLVFSTLHTNDAPGAVTRLLDLGVKPFLAATSLRATVAQRLVRKICPHCARPHAPTAAELAAINLTAARATSTAFRRGAGCPECAQTGYRGRLGIFEIFPVNAEVQRLIHEDAGAARLRACARQFGMRTMREDGLRKAAAGLTTIEEVMAATVGDAS